MDLFQNLIDLNKFKSTNAIWNELKLNSPWSVGYVTNLIESSIFSSKEEWRDYYYNSGKERLLQIGRSRYVNELMDFKNFNPDIPYEEKLKNFKYGRTEEELRQRGIYLFEEIQKRGNPLKITQKECIYAVKFRVIGETWNGVILREKSTILQLKKLHPEIEFIKVSGELDYKYAIDYELYKNGKRIAAIQIKPLSYKNGTSEEIQVCKNLNSQKNEIYTNTFGVNVYYIYSTSSGRILSIEKDGEPQTDFIS